MLWEIHGHTIEIIASEKREVRCIRWTEKEKIIAADAALPHDELRHILKKMLRTRKTTTAESTHDVVNVFSKKWPLKVQYGTDRPYIVDNMICCFSNTNRVTVRQIEKIKETLFMDLILQEVGQWEERLKVLVGQVVCRKRILKPFHIVLKQERITFCRSLENLSSDLIAYTVFRAMMTYVQLPIHEQAVLADRYFPLGMHYNKILSYEYAGYF